MVTTKTEESEVKTEENLKIKTLEQTNDDGLDKYKECVKNKFEEIQRKERWKKISKGAAYKKVGNRKVSPFS